MQQNLIDPVHPVDRHVGRRVTEARNARGYSQSDLARALGLTFQQVQKYEKATNRISCSKLWDISRFLGVGTDYFFHGLETGSPAAAKPGANIDKEPPATAQSLAISRLAARLPVGRQKLVLEVIRALDPSAD